MTMPQDYDAALDQLIRDAVATLTNGEQLVTRWVLVYEVASGDGRVPLTTASTNVALNDRAGLLHWATVDTDRSIGRVLDLFEAGQ